MWDTFRLGLIFLVPPFAKKWLLRWFYGAKLGRKANIGWFSAVSGKHICLGDYSVIRPLTIISLSGEVQVGDYSEISSFTLIYGSASLKVGNWCYIGPQSLLNVDEDVEIGDESALGPRCMVFTHGSFLPYTEGYWVKRAGVRLGRRVWCAAGVFIHPGVEIGEHTFVNSRAVVTQSLPPGSVAEGNPARVIYPIERLIRKPSQEYLDLAMRKVLHDFAEVGLRRELRLSPQAIHGEESQLWFRWRGVPYRVILIPSAGDVPTLNNLEAGEKLIYLINRPNWKPGEGAMVFDLSLRQTRYTSDPIHTSLRLFMLRYYGIRFVDR